MSQSVVFWSAARPDGRLGGAEANSVASVGDRSITSQIPGQPNQTKPNQSNPAARVLECSVRCIASVHLAPSITVVASTQSYDKSQLISSLHRPACLSANQTRLDCDR